MRNRPACHMRSLLPLVLIALPRFEGKAVGNAEGDIIIGGKDIDISEAPHMVSILYGGNLRCGGSIIDEYTILTAAHCLYRVSIPGLIWIRTGSSFFNKRGTVHEIENFRIHEKYPNNRPDYDVGLIRVKEPIVFGKNARPIALATEEPGTGTTVRITGWGETGNLEAISERLKSTEVDIVDWKKCKAVYKRLTKRMICAARPGKDSCQGDSGGGVDFNGTVVGIVSFGKNCADPLYPGVYTNVADPEILAFIKRRLD